MVHQLDLLAPNQAAFIEISTAAQGPFRVRLRKVLDVTLVIISFLARAFIVSIARHGFLHLKPLNLFTSHLSETLTTQGLGFTVGLSLQHDDLCSGLSLLVSMDYHGSCAIFFNNIISFNHRGLASTSRPRNHTNCHSSHWIGDLKFDTYYPCSSSAVISRVLGYQLQTSTKNLRLCRQKFHHLEDHPMTWIRG